jgi:hypothetical protein
MSRYFEAMEFDGLPFDLVDVELTRADQVPLADGGAGEGGWVADLLTAETPVPGPGAAYEGAVDRIRQWHRSLSERFVAYLAGLALWDRLDDTDQARAVAAVRDRLPPLAVDRYEVLYRRLAVEVAEFG